MTSYQFKYLDCGKAAFARHIQGKIWDGCSDRRHGDAACAKPVGLNQRLVDGRIQLLDLAMQTVLVCRAHRMNERVARQMSGFRDKDLSWEHRQEFVRLVVLAVEEDLWPSCRAT